MPRRKKNKSLAATAASSARRPKRQRKGVQHYTDDNPSTFTTKDKGGDSQHQRDNNNKHNSNIFSSESESSGESDSTNDHLSAGDGDDPSLRARKKRKRGTISSSAARTKSVFKKTAAAAATSGGNKAAAGTGASGVPNKTATAPPPVPAAPIVKYEEVPPSPPPKTVALPHAAAVVPIIPLAESCPQARFSLENQYPVVFGRGLGPMALPAKPEWNHVPWHDFYFPQDYKTVHLTTTTTTTTTTMACSNNKDATTTDSTTAKVLVSGPWPVCRVVTCLEMLEPSQTHVAVGDSAGFISIFYVQNSPGTLPLHRLESTSACQREYQRQRDIQHKLELQFKYKPELLAKRSPFWATAKTPNSIDGISWVGTLLIVVTPQEVEALELVLSSTSSTSTTDHQQPCTVSRRLWTIPILPIVGDFRSKTNGMVGGGTLGSSLVKLHSYKGNNGLLWNTWGMAPVIKTTSREPNQTMIDSSATNDDDDTNNNYYYDEDKEQPYCAWPLFLIRRPNRALLPGLSKIVPRHHHHNDTNIGEDQSSSQPPLWDEGTKCHAALWDNRDRNAELTMGRVIMVYSELNNTNGTENQVQLALVNITDDDITNSSNREEDTTNCTGTDVIIKPLHATIQKQVAIPISKADRNLSGSPEVSVRQSPKGTYTLVAGSRGVRMFETESLTALRVYGEHVSLHGKNMVWQSCFVLDNNYQNISAALFERNANSIKENPSKTVIRITNRQGGFAWLEQDDPLDSWLAGSKKDAAAKESLETVSNATVAVAVSKPAARGDNDRDEDDEAFWLHQAWIVGVPHAFRGPKELRETLYFYQGDEKLPLFTLPLAHESGGVQSIHPVASTPIGGTAKNSNDLMLRLVVSTINGECVELARTLKTNFPGIMYNSGYLVVQENVEYIEDEDELDKVIKEVVEHPEQEGESEGEDEEEAVLGAVIGEEVVDKDLAEAIRLSLLEVQGTNPAAKVRASEKAENKASTSTNPAHDDDDDDDDDSVVIVKDDFDGPNDEDTELIVPCQPEPFLRQRFLPDLETGEMLENDEFETASNRSAKDAAFANGVLAILPQSKAAQDLWDEQKTKGAASGTNEGELDQASNAASSTVAPAYMTTVGPVAAAQPALRLGKPKRSKLGNLENLLMNSIDPKIRQYMSARDRRWADGHGSSLQEDAWDYAVVTEFAINSEFVEPNVPKENKSATIEDEVTSEKGASEHNVPDKAVVPAAAKLTPVPAPENVDAIVTTDTTQYPSPPPAAEEVEPRASKSDEKRQSQSLLSDTVLSQSIPSNALTGALMKPLEEASSRSHISLQNGMKQFSYAAMFGSNLSPAPRVPTPIKVAARWITTATSGSPPSKAALRIHVPREDAATSTPPPDSNVDGGACRSRAQDEKEIAMELLLLSPSSTPRGRSNEKRATQASSDGLPSLADDSQTSSERETRLPGVDSGVATFAKTAINAKSESMEVAIIELKEYSGLEQDYSCTGTIHIPFSLADDDDADMEDTDCSATPENPEESDSKLSGSDLQEAIYKSNCKSGQNLIGDDFQNTDKKVDNSKKANAIVKCAACQGRMVIHSCGKRDLPVDFEAIARAEKEKREKEEVEKKRLRIEKRKQADAKRREAKRKKKEQDEQKKREEEQRKVDEERKKREREEDERRVREFQLAEARARMPNIEEETKKSGDDQHAYIAAGQNAHNNDKLWNGAAAPAVAVSAGSTSVIDALEALAGAAEAATPQNGTAGFGDDDRFHEGAHHYSSHRTVSRIAHGFSASQDLHQNHRTMASFNADVGHGEPSSARIVAQHGFSNSTHNDDQRLRAVSQLAYSRTLSAHTGGHVHGFGQQEGTYFECQNSASHLPSSAREDHGAHRVPANFATAVNPPHAAHSYDAHGVSTGEVKAELATASGAYTSLPSGRIQVHPLNSTNYATQSHSPEYTLGAGTYTSRAAAIHAAAANYEIAAQARARAQVQAQAQAMVQARARELAQAQVQNYDIPRQAPSQSFTTNAEIGGPSAVSQDFYQQHYMSGASPSGQALVQATSTWQVQQQHAPAASSSDQRD